ncbi:MAG: radical SAM/SPASM domain-containing protein [Deltaproteobacteria bacterium]
MITAQTKTIKPGFCCFGITDKCMLRCKMCQKWKDDIYVKNPQESPTLEQWKQCVSDLAQMVEFPFELDIGGGEALMFDGVLDVVRYSVDKGFNTSIASNGYLIDKEMARRIADSGLKAISISMDSLKEEVHDYLRGIPGVYRRAMNAIDYVHEYCKGIYINLCCVFYEFNQEAILDLVEWANNNHKIGSINFMAAMQPNNTSPLEDWWHSGLGAIWPKNPDRTVEIIQKIIDLKQKGYKIGNPSSQLKAFQAYYVEPKKFVKRKQCNLDRCVLVSSVGDIYLCYDFEKIGNIKQDRLIDMWFSDKADKVRKDISGCTKNCHHLINCFDEFDKDFPL